MPFPSTQQLVDLPTLYPISIVANAGGRGLLQAAFTEAEKGTPIACLADVVALEDSGEIKLGGARA